MTNENAVFDEIAAELYLDSMEARVRATVDEVEARAHQPVYAVVNGRAFVDANLLATLGMANSLGLAMLPDGASSESITVNLILTLKELAQRSNALVDQPEGN